MLRRALFWLLESAALFGLYLLFAGAKAHEMIVGAAAAALAALGLEVVRNGRHPPLIWRVWPIARRFWRLPWQIVRDCGKLLFNLISARDGHFVRVPCEAGDDSPAGTAHRAIETLYQTLPPNTIVIGIDRERNEILLHVLEGEA